MSAPDFQSFQRAFARHIRDPRQAPRPAGVPTRRMRVYNELLFNNITGFLDACFPVCRRLLGDKRWRRLNRSFFRDWPSHTPWFREIPSEFVRYLQTCEIRQPLPAWFTELAHYEWAELAVDTINCPVSSFDPNGELMADAIVPNPAMLVLTYAWPVHHISTEFRPRKPKPCHLVIYRDAEDSVHFVEINPLTACLLGLLISQPMSGEAACRQLAEEIQHPDPLQLIHFGHGLLKDFLAQGILLGTQTPVCQTPLQSG